MTLDPLICANPGCRKQFTPESRRERYCKKKCAVVGERIVKRNWWTRNRTRRGK